MREKLYRLIVLLLTIILVFNILPTAKNYFEQRSLQSNEKLVVATNASGNVLSTNVIDNTVLKVKYTKDIDKYTLYRDDVEYSLSTTKYGNNLVIDLSQSNTQNYEGVVVGQCPLVIPLVLWTPAIIEATQITISATVAVVGTYTVWYSVDSIEKNISKTKTDTKVNVKEKTPKVVGYYSAALLGGKVVISKPITYEDAVIRLIAGMDVFATSKAASYSAALAATVPNTKPIYHQVHDSGGEGFYAHFHPGGRKWIVNINYQPHCWFGPTP